MKIADVFGREDLKEKFVLQKFLCMFLECSRESLWARMDEDISEESIQKILTAYKSYVEDRKPLEYILGHVDFFGKEFFVNEATLIPRPETEYMITAVSEYIGEQGTVKNEKGIMKNEKGRNTILLDIGTGCGVLGVSVLLQNPKWFSTAILTDYFADALEVAQKNVAHHLVSERESIHLVQSDLLAFLYDTTWDVSHHHIVLVANLPYIPEETFEANAADNVKKREPKPAFVGGDDGLDYYKQMFHQLFSLIENGKLKIENGFVMFLEMMTWQIDILRTLYGEFFEFEEVKTFHFNIRIVKLSFR